MKNPKRDDELTSWIKDVSSISGRETLIVTKEESNFSAHLAEKLLLFTVVIAMTFAVSAAYYMNYSPESGGEQLIDSMGMPPTVVSAVITDKPANLFSEQLVTMPETTTTTVAEPIETTTTTTTTTLEPTTTTTLSCGGELEAPCLLFNEYKCDPGFLEGSEGLCHEKKCAPTVPSGNSDGKCGAYALQYCDEAV